MAGRISKLLTLCLLLASLASGAEVAKDSSPVSRESGEKITNIHFYFHDIVVGTNPTAIRVAEASTTKLSITGFGAVVMIDDPLTDGPEITSNLIGRAQGIYSFASQEDFGLLMILNYVFVGGEYNGSTLSVVGRNNVLSSVREMSVVGGTGLFRLARGYTQASTYSFDYTTGNTIVEYNVTVLHY